MLLNSSHYSADNVNMQWHILCWFWLISWYKIPVSWVKYKVGEMVVFYYWHLWSVLYLLQVFSKFGLVVRIVTYTKNS